MRRALSWISFCAVLLLAGGAGATTSLSFDDIGAGHGSVVGSQYDGVTIRALNYNRDFHLAVAFDSNASDTRDPDLEAASGGATAWSGGNLEGTDLGLMLILQENDDIVLNGPHCGAQTPCYDADDEGGRKAGQLVFEFDVAPHLFGFSIVDIESTNAENGSIIFHEGSQSRTVSFASFLDAYDLGDNKANAITPFEATDLGLTAFDKVVIELGGSGAIDDVVYANAPEPSTALLLGFGLTGLAVAGRRRR